MQLNQEGLERERVKQRMKTRMQQEKERLASDMKNKIKVNREQLKVWRHPTEKSPAMFVFISYFQDSKKFMEC